MAPSGGVGTAGLTSFLRSISSEPDETLIELLISLLRRRQIRTARPCAVATAYLLRRIVVKARPDPGKSIDSAQLLRRVQEVGRRLVAAQPRELVVQNLVRRVLGLIREEREHELAEGDVSRPPSEAGSENGGLQARQAFRNGRLESQANVNGMPTTSVMRSPAATEAARSPSSQTTTPARPSLTSMFSLFSHPTVGSPRSSPVPGSPSGSTTPSMRPLGSHDTRQEVIEGIAEIIDELEQSDEQIASYAPEQIHTNEVILTYSSSTTVQRFLLKAAAKRKFTVIHAESYPNHHQKVHSAVTDNKHIADPDTDDLPTETLHKTLAAAGVTVILIPDSAIFALMSRANKVIVGTHAVLSNGALVAASGTKLVAKAAKAHCVPVVVLSGTYQLSPTAFPHDPDEYLEYGDASKVFPYQDRELVDGVDVENPTWDLVGPECVDMYITNLGGHAPSYLYRVIRDQYRDEDVDFCSADRV